MLVAGKGIEGDHYQTSRDGPRQATLIASESIQAIASFLGRETLPPDLLRRNLVTRGLNLVALKGRRFRIGPALLEASGDCAPCSQMEEALGTGGYNAVRGHGGITARIIEGGSVAIGDEIVVVD
jgi:MOSC domain-containing protein YiiM